MAGIVLAAGEGRRLRPLTTVRAKPLCPVAGEPLVDRALRQVRAVVAEIAVNVHHHRAAIEAHLDGSVHLSVEEPEALGTAGALRHLRSWLGGRAVLAVNGDTWHDADLGAFVDGWDGERPAVLVAAGHAVLELGVAVCASITPWKVVAELEERPAGLFQRVWAPRLGRNRVQVVATVARCFDCGTPGRYLDANLAVAGGSVIGAGAVVEGEVVDSVLWPGTRVSGGERLVRAIRASDRMTVLAR